MLILLHASQHSNDKAIQMLVRPCFKLIGLITLLLLANSSAFASDLSWLPVADLPISTLLLPPPCDNCRETEAELAELLEFQRSRTPEAATRAEKDTERTLASFLDRPGLQLRIGQLHKCVRCDGFFEGLEESAAAITEVAKETFRRTRPYKLPNSGLQPLKDLKSDDSFSYPSGHAAFGTLAGIVLAQMIPEKRTEIFKRINDYCRSRMVAGVHYRSDVYAGQIVGSAVATTLFRNPSFNRDFEEVKAQLRNALGLF